MRTTRILQGGVLALSLLAATVMAAVSPDEAAKLGTSLTPLGAEKAGNADGSIPEWTGGLPKNAAAIDANGFLGDPFASEKPLFTITAANAAQYKDKLSEGQLAMFKRYPRPTRSRSTPPTAPPPRRTPSTPPPSRAPSTPSRWTAATACPTSPPATTTPSRFPGRRPGAVEPHHPLPWRQRPAPGGAGHPQTNGSFSPVQFQDEVAFPGDMSDLDQDKAANILLYFKQRVLAPSRLAGNVLLVHETIDQVKEPRLAWIYNAGQRRVRRAPQVAYDGPGTAADGMRTADNFDMFSGAPDRYDWKLIGKKEMYIPYNSYKLDSTSLTRTSSRPATSTRT